MLEIQRIVKKFTSILDANYFLKEKLSLNIKQAVLKSKDNTSEGDTVYVYNYDMIKSPRQDPVVNEARGLILDTNGDVVSIAFTRFFNYNEGISYAIDWNTARAEMKYDGSLVVVYNYKGNWYIQTRSEPMAEGRLPSSNITFRIAVEEILKELLIDDDPFVAFRDKDDSYCYIFEFVSPYNRIVTPYATSNLVLLTIRDKLSLTELPFEVVDNFAYEFGFERPEWAPVESLDEALAALSTLDPLEEGFVIVDDCFKRLKIKNPNYLTVAHTVHAGKSLNLEHFAAMCLSGESQEISGYFPEYAPLLDTFNGIIKDLTIELYKLWASYGSLISQKEFAIAVKDHPLSGLLFAKRSGKLDSLEKAIYKIKPSLLTEISKKRMKTHLENELQNVLIKEASEYAKERSESDVVY